MIEKYWAVIRAALEANGRGQKLKLQELAQLLNARGFHPEYGGQFTGAGRGVARLVAASHKFAEQTLGCREVASIIAGTITNRFGGPAWS